MNDTARQTLGDGGLADTGVTHVKRVVLGATAKDLDGPLHLLIPADQRIDLPAGRLLVKVDTICLESLSAFLHDLLRRSVVVSSRYPLCFIAARRLRDPVRDIVYRVEPGHFLLLQVIDRMALAFRKQRNKHIGPSHFFTTGTLYVDRRPLEHPLEAGSRLRVFGTIGDQVGEFVVEVFTELGAQLVEVDATGSQDRYGILILGEREQQVLKRGVFVTALVGVG